MRITRCPSFHPVLDLVQRRNRAVVIEIAAGRAAHADAADRFIARQSSRPRQLHSLTLQD
jgi:hypothetical protein